MDRYIQAKTPLSENVEVIFEFRGFLSRNIVEFPVLLFWSRAFGGEEFEWRIK